MVGTIACGEVGDHRTARPLAPQLHLRHQDVGCAILIEDSAPPPTAAAAYLAAVHQQRVGAGAGQPDIVDDAVARAKARPGLLPGRRALEHRRRAPGFLERHDQQRGRAERLPGDAQDRARAPTIEQHAELCNVAVRSDLLILDDDPAHQRVERRIGKRARTTRQASGQNVPALALRQPPACGSRGFGIGAGYIDGNAGNLETTGTCDRRDPAAAVLDLRDHGTAGSKQRHQQAGTQSSGKAQARHRPPFDEAGVEIQAGYG